VTKRLTVPFTLLGLLLVAAPGHAATLKLSWTPPTQRSDGTTLALNEIGGYKIFYGTTVGVYTGTGADQGPSPIDVPASAITNAANPSYFITGMTTCQGYHIVMTTYDVDGRESAYSAPVFKTPVDSPATVNVQAGGPGALQLSWSGVPSGDTGSIANYRVYYDLDGQEPYTGVGAQQGSSPLTIAGTVRNFSLSGLPANTRYYVAVESLCADGTTNITTATAGQTGATLPPPPPPPDYGVPPQRDMGVVPPPDFRSPVSPDYGYPQPSYPDSGGYPQPRYPDYGNPGWPSPDQGTPYPSPSYPRADAGFAGSGQGGQLVGSCSVGGSSDGALLGLVLMMLFALRRRRR
jgi:MYXO-CTERM domain-containing protein